MTVALDLFAGTGWGVACQALGIEEHGVELMPAAVATREANGMRTAYRDVWEGLDRPELVPEHDLLIASPPCQTFSLAGGGAGRRALTEVVELIEDGTWLDPDALRGFGAEHDDRTALVLTPLTYAMRYRPRAIVLEQVPPVLPVWQAIARVLALNGYQVATGVLHAEAYGVPQTRKRAILVARRGGEAKLPTPTHSRYYPRDPQRLDPGVLPWVSMAQALGWGDAPELVGFPRRADGVGESIDIDGEAYRARDLRPSDRPSAVMTGKSRSWHRWGLSASGTATWMRSSQSVAGGDRAMRSTDAPALTITGNSSRASWVTVAEAVAERVNDQTGTAHDVEWPAKRPATTIPASRGFVRHPGATVNRYNGSTQSRNDGIRLSVAEAAALQTYPEGFAWAGSATSAFQQIGNAVCPLLAEAILRQVL